MKKLIIVLLIFTLVLVGCKTDAKIKESNQEKQTTESTKLDVAINEKVMMEYAYSGELKDMLKDSDFVTLIEVLDKEEAWIPKGSRLPQTAFKAKVIENLKGKLDVDEINVVLTGGTVKLKEFKLVNQNESNQKMGLNDMSEDDLEKKYISIYPDAYTELEKGNTYIVFLKDYRDEGRKTNEYHLRMDGYGIYKKEGDFYKCKMWDTSVKKEAFK